MELERRTEVGGVRRARRWALTAAAAAAVLAGPGAGPAAVAERTAGVVISLKGKPRIQRVGTEDWKPIRVNMQVHEGDRIETRGGQLAALAFVGGAELRINENSVFEISSGGGADPASLSTKVGQAWTRLLHGKAGLNIRTPSAVASVRGTEADVESEERATTVKVYEGHVDVFNDQGSQSVLAGQMTQAAAGGAPEAPRSMGDADKESWQSAVAPKRVQLEITDKDGNKIVIDLEKK